jgi:acetylornithine deacetylase/succinyl-diaminopimelate desuccinylase-like protein
MINADAGGVNVIPGAATVRCCRRVVPGEDLAAIRSKLISVSQGAVDDLGLGLTLSTHVISEDPAFWEDPEASLVRRLSTLAGTAPVPAPYGTNATG